MSSEGRQPGINRAIVQVVARALADLGASPREFPGDPAGYVDGPVADALVDDAAVELGDPALGLTVARRLAPGTLGPIDYSMLTAATWGEALARSGQFYAVVSERVAMWFEPVGDEVHIIQRRLPDQIQNRHWVEMTFAAIVDRGRLAVGPDFRVSSVAFLHPAPPDVTTHAAFFAAPVTFSQPVDRLVFDRALLAAPLRTGAAELSAAIERQLAELVPATLDPTMLRVRRVLAQAIDTGTATLEAVARQLQMSTRTLQRVLRDHETTFKTLLDDMRRDRALAMLREGTLTMAEIAAKVGFSDPAGFFRAFRRWTGSTPGAQRPP